MARPTQPARCGAMLGAVLVALAAAAASCDQPLVIDHRGEAGVPNLRTDASSVYDPANGTVVMFGGANRFGVLDETWTWDGQTWRSQHPSLSPPARELAVMAFDPATNRVILFGGESCPPPKPVDTIGCDYVKNATILGDTWTWDGANWAQVMTQHAPPVTYFNRDFVGAATDQAHGRLVLVTLWPHEPDFNLGTWTLEQGDWRQLQSKHSPLAYIFGGPAFDAISGTVVLQQAAPPDMDCISACPPVLDHNATLEWDGSDWKDLGRSVNSPHWYGTLLSIGKTGVMMVGDGAEIQWNGSRWTGGAEMPWGATPRTGWTAAYHEPTHQLVLFGGRVWGTNHLFGDTFGWDGHRWNTTVAAQASPSSGPLPACVASQAEAGSGGGIAPADPSSEAFELDFHEPPAGPCHINVTVKFTILSRTGAVLPIVGNPSTYHLEADLTFGAGTQRVTFTVTGACALEQGDTATYDAGDIHFAGNYVASGQPCASTPPPVTITASLRVQSP